MTKKAQEKIIMIEDRARLLFAERGYRAVAMDDVAAAVGMARTTLYDYFDSKEEILYGLVERHVVGGQESPPPGPVALRLVHTMAASMRRLKNCFDLYRILFAERPVLGDELGVRLGQWQSRLLGAVRSVLEEAVGSGEFAPRGGVAEAMFMYQAVLSQFLNQALIAGDIQLLGENEEAEASRLVELMLKGTGGL
jgi:AcrR family transcriptional regulator